MKKIILCLVFGLPIISIKAADPLWMRYPAISPDGKSIVFSYQEDLFIVPTEGGEAKPITRHIAYDFMPVWSPNGKLIAYASDQYGNFDVFIYNIETGSNQRLTHHSANDYPTEFIQNGKTLVFSSTRTDLSTNAQFPSSRLPELYSIDLEGKTIKQVLTTPADNAVFNKRGDKIYFHNRKGYENDWRKHHQSSVARDIMEYDSKTGKFRFLTDFAGEDRNPVLSADERSLYYLSEESGDFNIWKLDINKPSEKKQLTRYKGSPVRFLSSSSNNLLCFSYRGEIFTLSESGGATRVRVEIKPGDKKLNDPFVKLNSGITEMVPSPDGKEIALIIRGEVFVTSTDHSQTRQITETAWQERNVRFSPDGRTLLYAAEKGNSWSVYRTNLVRSDEKHFYNATQLNHEPVIENEKECFQPNFSPDGTEVAFLEERTTLKVINLKSQKVRTILPAKYNYSYSDGDQWYEWSPDGQWFTVEFNDSNRWTSEVGIIPSDGSGQLINLTQSGYSDFHPTWMADGKVIMYYSDRYGMRSHASWGSETDVLGIFLTQKAYDQYVKPDFEEDAELPDDKDKDKAKEKDKAPAKVEFEKQGLEQRKVRFSLHSAHLSDAVLNKKADKLYYLARFEKGFDLWVYNIKDKSAKVLSKFDSYSSGLVLDKDEKNAFLISGGQMFKVDLTSGAKTSVSFEARMKIDYAAERDYMFEHVWRQMKKKFYRVDMQGVNWDIYKKEYERYLPHITHNYDFAEMLSEMLGEVNASHTGSGYRSGNPEGDQTASLAIHIDYTFDGEGVKIGKIIPGSPLVKNASEIAAGSVITALNGNPVVGIPDFIRLLNHMDGKKVSIDFVNEKGKTSQIDAYPISMNEEMSLRYDDWVKERMETVEKLSNGRIGYVHVHSMDDASYRQVYSDLLGKHSGKEAVIVDTRFNGGGWLHDDLATLLSGKKYVDFEPRGQHVGSDPHKKWNKPSCILVSEGNYSDAHGFPYTYQTLGIGKVIGMPVPGTMTAVWWETLIDPTLYFGIPQVGSLDLNGEYLENKQLKPDIMVDNELDKITMGQDQQLEAAVAYLLETLNNPNGE